MGGKTKATMLTLLVSIVNSLMVVVLNLIYNNFIIRLYGSSVNGLIATLSQFVGLFSIVEGGVTTAAIVATYEPFVKRQHEKLNDILYTTQMTYYRCGIIITFFVLVIGAVYVNFLDTPFSSARTYALLVVTVLSTAISLCFQSKYSVLLQGANREYVQVIIALISKSLTWIVSIILILNHANIVLVYAINVVNVILNVVLLAIYEKTRFPYITYKGKYRKEYIKGTKDVLFQKVANTIFTSTDLVLISSCVSLTMASVYGLYRQIFLFIFNTLAGMVQAPFNSFGHLYKEENKNAFNKYFLLYQKMVLVVSSILLTLTGSLIISFIRIYTRGITDVDYINPSLVILFFMQFYVQLNNRPFGTALNVTGNFSKQNLQCGIAVVVNLTLSIIGVRQFGVTGVVFGTFIGVLVILLMNIWQCYKQHLIEGVIKIGIDMIVNFMFDCFLIMSSIYINIEMKNYLYWCMFAVIMSLLYAVVIVLINIIIDKKNMVEMMKYVWGKILSRLKQEKN